MGSIKEYKCLNCNAGVEFNPVTQGWKCLYCFSEYTKDQLDASLNAKDESSMQSMPELDSYRCGSCGAELIADATTSATFCVYCKNHSIIKSRFAGEFKPSYLIPFRLTKDQAKEAYKTWIGQRILAPDAFKHKDTVDKLTGIYAPFWLFNCKAEGMVEGEGTHVSSWRDGDYEYTQTKYYRVVRQGRADYERVPVDASEKLNDEFMQLIEPYHYDDLKDFSMQYLTGFMAEKYDVNASEAEDAMKSRVEQYMDERLKNTVTGYSSFSIHSQQVELSDTAPNYAMLPIYLLINRYQGEDHVFIVNGQTGKVVGDTPISPLRQIVFAGTVFAALWVLFVFGGALFA